MPESTPTWRTVDGDVVHGLQRLIYTSEYDAIRKVHRYRLEHLRYFADGRVSWGYGSGTDLAGLRAALADGTLVLRPPEGTEVFVPGLGPVTIGPAEQRWTAEMLLGDLADELDRLNDRPDSSHRAYTAFVDYAEEPTPVLLEAARAAYLAIPEHRRIFFLGDMDQNDVPARVLLAADGDRIAARAHGRTLVVSPKKRDWALDYFRRERPALERWEARRTADGPEIAAAAPVTFGRRHWPNGWPADPGVEVLQNGYPAAVVHDGREYRSVEHAYWALSTDDPAWHDRIAAADRGHDARTAGMEAPRRPDWAERRLAVMLELLRDKYRRNPAVAAVLLGTGDARLLAGDAESRYWSVSGQEGTNWVGRLLEVARSELAADAVRDSRPAS
ncbi:NADAR family protein [Actinoplanes couchii]|uniref:Riboflavin biosynthesis intermediates N-glycosidase n=1 Tax=Actinoplanes couchii TaxID=403638 RepID=A0ABQ3X1H2_9ACTN|nr:NADAR family protein [Actinoplanes couchii]MDR6316767.1 putative NAD-dependent protein-ADP-ribosyltransferase YbiA (DUF1768 family) [Actinoplanes couchii]GID52375.1 hypothetical protein Aco03nite_007790 [Actinoplanes couchii]